MSRPPDSARWSEDHALVQRVLSGDRVARRAFAERMSCVPSFLSAANARHGKPLGRDDLADLTQDTLILIWRKLETYEGRATLESWCWRFCQLEFSNRARRGFRHKALRGPDLEDVPEPPAPGETPAMEYDHLERGLRALAPAEEEVIRLKHFEHLMFKEIADRLDISPNTAKTRYYRGMAALKQQLEAQDEREESR